MTPAIEYWDILNREIRILAYRTLTELLDQVRPAAIFNVNL